MYPTFQILGRTIGSYAVCGVAGLLASGFVASRMAKRVRLPFEELVLVMLVILAGLFIGGHALYAVVNLDEILLILRDCGQKELPQVLRALGHCVEGMVYYGGFLGGVAALKFYLRFHAELREKKIIDIYAVCVPMFHGFARIGCFFGGCCYGVPSRFGFLVTDNQLTPAINGVRRFPTPLTESVCNFIIFMILYRLYLRGRKEKELLYWYIYLYAPIRFLLEFLRGDEVRGFFLCFSTSQWISVVLFVAAIVLSNKSKKMTE